MDRPGEPALGAVRDRERLVEALRAITASTGPKLSSCHPQRLAEWSQWPVGAMRSARLISIASLEMSPAGLLDRKNAIAAEL